MSAHPASGMCTYRGPGRPGTALRAHAAPRHAPRVSYDVAAVRACFPALRAGAAHFDGPGGSQVPESVAAAVAATLTAPIANRGRVTQAERNADDRSEERRVGKECRSRWSP